MNRVLLLLIVLMGATAMVKADDKKKKATKPVSEVVNTKSIEWLSFDEAEKRMQKEPRKVWIDVYTDWCGWCKVLDKKVFTHPEVIKYMNTKFYAIKFDAERQDSFMFAGKKWGFNPQYRANMLAVQLMGGQMSYPTSVFMEDNFQSPSPIPGYHPVPEMEGILKYLAEGTYKTVKYDEYLKTFQPQWKEIITPEVPMGAH